MKMLLDDINRKLLNLLQRDFPLCQEPFSSLGERIGFSEEEVIQRIERLKERGIIREISPVLDARRLGYKATFSLMKIPPGKLEKAAKFVSQHPMVSHCHEREYRFNLSFTLTSPAEADIEDELMRLGELVGAESVLNLPPLRLFKLGVYFDMAGDGWHVPQSRSSTLPERVRLSSVDRAVLNKLQQDLPLTQRPFEILAQEAGVEEEKFLQQCKSLKERGIIRRFNASVNHRGLGFVANALVCWKVPLESVESTGRKIASFREISHCLERKTDPLWEYNLYAVIHSHSKESCEESIKKIGKEIGLEFVSLFSRREFKKSRVRYLV